MRTRVSSSSQPWPPDEEWKAHCFLLLCTTLAPRPGLFFLPLGATPAHPAHSQPNPCPSSDRGRPSNPPGACPSPKPRKRPVSPTIPLQQRQGASQHMRTRRRRPPTWAAALVATLLALSGRWTAAGRSDGKCGVKRRHATRALPLASMEARSLSTLQPLPFPRPPPWAVRVVPHAASHLSKPPLEVLLSIWCGLREPSDRASSGEYVCDALLHRLACHPGVRLS